jgi:hypothetical protein
VVGSSHFEERHRLGRSESRVASGPSPDRHSGSGRMRGARQLL